ncbi:MAG: leucine-rich repeat domain-containing protein [Promethearchaeota archaeon]
MKQQFRREIRKAKKIKNKEERKLVLKLYRDFSNSKNFSCLFETSKEGNIEVLIFNIDFNSVPEEIVKLKHMVFFASDNSLISSKLLDIIGKNLKDLEILELINNSIITIPKSICELEKLEYLGIFNNKITGIPKEICKLRNLESLNFNNNQITSIPKSICELEKLKFLELKNNKITRIPKEIYKLKNLEFLDLSNNKIETIPSSLCELKNLEMLQLKNNKLCFLPDNIGDLKNLFELDLSNNQIERFPESFKNLAELELLNFKNNKIRSFSNVPFNFFDQNFEISNLSREIMISGYFPEFFNSYKKSAKELILQYIKNPKSLTYSEKERIIWEASGIERRILELKVQPDDPVLMAINSRLSIKNRKDSKLKIFL